ncbi:hypothetical protein GMOD_00010295 [Pyrenophora seminiperda CCB06]|uniref:Uncharacterized protein n=1 Tax=Pyrenophora seminiperda CCB06 TaxID=1302712 RepID=A0A3M7M5H9_9PLEO|nr:hypothetical protein GMOD_00010295 [Pyrenophora seminiperda CCB06]
MGVVWAIGGAFALFVAVDVRTGTSAANGTQRTVVAIAVPHIYLYHGRKSMRRDVTKLGIHEVSLCSSSYNVASHARYLTCYADCCCTAVQCPNICDSFVKSPLPRSTPFNTLYNAISHWPPDPGCLPIKATLGGVGPIGTHRRIVNYPNRKLRVRNHPSTLTQGKQAEHQLLFLLSQLLASTHSWDSRACRSAVQFLSLLFFSQASQHFLQTLTYSSTPFTFPNTFYIRSHTQAHFCPTFILHKHTASSTMSSNSPIIPKSSDTVWWRALMSDLATDIMWSGEPEGIQGGEMAPLPEYAFQAPDAFIPAGGYDGTWDSQSLQGTEVLQAPVQGVAEGPPAPAVAVNVPAVVAKKPRKPRVKKVKDQTATASTTASPTVSKVTKPKKKPVKKTALPVPPTPTNPARTVLELYNSRWTDLAHDEKLRLLGPLLEGKDPNTGKKIGTAGAFLPPPDFEEIGKDLFEAPALPASSPTAIPAPAPAPAQDDVVAKFVAECNTLPTEGEGGLVDNFLANGYNSGLPPMGDFSSSSPFTPFPSSDSFSADLFAPGPSFGAANDFFDANFMGNTAFCPMNNMGMGMNGMYDMGMNGMNMGMGMGMNGGFFPNSIAASNSAWAAPTTTTNSAYAAATACLPDYLPATLPAAAPAPTMPAPATPAAITPTMSAAEYGIQRQQDALRRNALAAQLGRRR